MIKDRSARMVPAIRITLARVEEQESRREAEEQLREHASLLDKARDPIIATDPGIRIVYWNASAERLYGWTAGEAFGRRLVDLNLGCDRRLFDQAHAQLPATGEWLGEFSAANPGRGRPRGRKHLEPGARTGRSSANHSHGSRPAPAQRVRCRWPEDNR